MVTINHGIVMYDPKNNVLEQLFKGLSFKEAYHQCTTLRGKNDGNYYWIGTKENHLGLIKR